MKAGERLTSSLTPRPPLHHVVWGSQAAVKSPLHDVGWGFRGGANTVPDITLPVSMILTRLFTPSPSTERGKSRA